MADVDDTLEEWSATPANNKPTGATTIGTGLDENLREIQAVVRKYLAGASTDVASATTTDIGAVASNYVNITGTTTITGLGTVSAGIWKLVKFAGALILTHNGTSLILPDAANITTVAGDRALFVSEGSGNWRCLFYDTKRSGVYTPTLSAGVNVESSTMRSAQYMRVGNTVTVSGTVEIDPTAATTTTWELDLPIASNFANGWECGGVLVAESTTPVVGGISASAANNTAVFSYSAASTALQNVRYHFTYKVI